MSQRPTDDPLSRWLHAGDPAGDDFRPTAAERARLWSRMLASLPRQRAAGRLRPATAVAAFTLALSVALTVALLRPGKDAGSGRGGSSPTPSRAGTAPDPDDRRQIQFATENGTRIIWVLDPDLTL